MFDDFGFAPALLPPADVYETKDEFVVEFEVPGFEEKELGIEVTDHTLVVKGERIETTEDPEKEFRLRERLEQTFERRFYVPADADTKHVKAKFRQGRARSACAKLAAPDPQKIEITRA
jgi:HSP20 family protein